MSYNSWIWIGICLCLVWSLLSYALSHKRQSRAPLSPVMISEMLVKFPPSFTYFYRRSERSLGIVIE